MVKDKKKKYLKQKPVSAFFDKAIFKDHKNKPELFADLTGESKKGGDYVKHTSNNKPDLRMGDLAAIEQTKKGWTETAYNIHAVDQMAVDNTRFDTRTRAFVRFPGAFVGPKPSGLIKRGDLIKWLLSRRYICTRCHFPHDRHYKWCPACSAPVIRRYPIYNLIKMDIEELKIIPGTELRNPKNGKKIKSTGNFIPGYSAYRRLIEDLRRPLALFLQENFRTVIGYHASKEESELSPRVGVVVTNYLERLKLIRLQLWNILYDNIGRIGSFTDINSFSLDKSSFKLSLPADAVGMKPYFAHHALSDKDIMLLSNDDYLKSDKVKDITPIKISGKDTIKKQRISISKKVPIYNEIKESHHHALIFRNNDYIAVIPQEKSMIFPESPAELYDLFALARFQGPRKVQRKYAVWDIHDIADTWHKTHDSWIETMETHYFNSDEYYWY